MTLDMSLAGATLAACPFSALFLSFLAYGALGWLWESTVCAFLNHGHFANSGFLLGPCCPIYGVGGVTCWLLLRGIADLGEQFVAAALVCSVIEYVVGVVLERTTGARFWDYSHLPFNLNGRICLYWACAFGLGAVVICRVTEPMILSVLALLPWWLVVVAAMVAAAVLAVDAVSSLASWRRLSEQLECVRADLADRINESLHDASDSMLEKIPESAVESVNQTHVRGRAINAWLAEIGDAALDALREKASVPTFIADGRRGLALTARRVSNAVPHPVRSVRASYAGWAERMEREGHGLRVPRARMRMGRPVPRVLLRRRDLRFFNAFPRLRFRRYDGVIRATGLADRARELFRR